METPVKISTGSRGMDNLLGGGLETKMITQFVGEAGSGKSTFCLLSAVNTLQEGKGVVYIDTEGFSVERFEQIAGDETEELAKYLFIEEPGTFAEQGRLIQDAEKILKAGKASLIVVDSATALYRVEQIDTRDALQQLSQQMAYLLALAKRYDVPAVITNQVFMDIDHHRLNGLGGTALAHISKAIVSIEKLEKCRRATIIKHRSQREGTTYDFTIVNEGVKDF